MVIQNIDMSHSEMERWKPMMCRIRTRRYDSGNICNRMFTMTDRRYKFSWDLLGDIALGRPNIGPNMRLEVYRLMQFTFRDIIEQYVGTEKTD